jgi:hypothetical protein
VCAVRSGGNEDALRLLIYDYVALEVNLEATFENQPDMFFFAPVRFDELGSEFHEADLLIETLSFFHRRICYINAGYAGVHCAAVTR